MILSEENYIKIINSFNKQDWQKLFDLIPKIKSASKFGKMVNEDKKTNRLVQMHYYKAEAIVDQFLKAVYELLIIINFDWASREEGREIIGTKSFDFDTIDVPTKCKLITFIVRADRFNDGALILAFESGLILKILESIQKQVV